MRPFVNLLVHVFDSSQDHDDVGESALHQEVKCVPGKHRKPPRFNTKHCCITPGDLFVPCVIVIPKQTIQK